MKTTIKNTLVSAVTGVIIVMSSNVLAKEKYPFKNEIEARQSLMQLTRFNLSVLGAMVKGEREYDPELAAATAQNMKALAKMDNMAMWPKGSDNAADGLKEHTDALPAVFIDHEALMMKQEAWVDASTLLAANAGKGKDELRKVLGAVGKSCKGCHDDFKQKK